MQFRFRKKAYKGVVAGAIGGLVASWAMPRFQSLLARALGESGPHEGQDEDATVKLAGKLSSTALDHELSPEEKRKSGPLVHYTYGTGLGAVYGALAQKREAMTSGFGAGYGAAAWVLGDEIGVPALRLGRKPSETPASQHLQALAAHVVYGVTLEGVRRLVLKML